MTKTLKKIASIICLTMTLNAGVTTLPPTTMTVYAKPHYVYVAPNYGTKYHLTRHCRGLNGAKKVKRVTYKWAKHHHHSKKCKWC